ncbi:MAG: agmatine deiminase family protein [Ilumatobacter sp.]|nr:agmatine deiminase family protein [Ilumatobacter sp.]
MNDPMRMPGEFAPHERTVICWPTRDAIYPGPLLDEARAAHAELAQAIARYEPVTMIAPPGTADDAAERCGGGVEVVEIPIDDSWFRDSGPIYVTGDAGARTAVDFAFNAWGEKFPPWDDDAAVARRWAEHAGHDTTSVDLVFEGGSISTDGEGSFVTTIQCLMHPNRNPTLTRARIEETLAAALGLESMLWLPHGLALDADTDGHVDNVAAFARPGVLVVQGCDDPDEPDHLLMDVNRRIADGWVDARGRSVAVVEVPVLPFRERDGVRVPVPYLNYYVGNGFVAVPTCGHPADADMLAIIAEQYPGRDAFGLDVGEILAIGGGGIHCVTQQVPAV